MGWDGMGWDPVPFGRAKPLKETTRRFPPHFVS